MPRSPTSALRLSATWTYPGPSSTMRLVSCGWQGKSGSPALAGAGRASHFASRLTLAVCLLAVFPAFGQPPPVHRPYLQNMRGDRVTIVWSTKDSLTGEVQYSTDQGFSKVISIPISGGQFFPRSLTKSSYDFYQYRADITGLAAGTDYYYRVQMGGQDLTVPGKGFF